MITERSRLCQSLYNIFINPTTRACYDSTLFTETNVNIKTFLLSKPSKIIQSYSNSNITCIILTSKRILFEIKKYFIHLQYRSSTY